MPTRRSLLVCLCLPLLFAGCRTLSNNEIDNHLRERLRLYESVVRWGALERMYTFIRPEDAVGLEVPEGLDNVRVISYETASGPSRVTEDRWVQTVAIEYVLQDRQIVKSLIDHQVWEREPDAEVWYRTNPNPQFR